MRSLVEEATKAFEASEDARLLDENFHSAYRLMTSTQAREAFDLSKEPMAIRERYGMNRFGQCCLLARRLVESGVRFITINTFLTVFGETTWDIHGSKPFTSIAGMKEIVCPMYDQAYSALIEDLAQRGMLHIRRRRCARRTSCWGQRHHRWLSGRTAGRARGPCCHNLSQPRPRPYRPLAGAGRPPFRAHRLWH
jgi:hypothetical protein